MRIVLPLRTWLVLSHLVVLLLPVAAVLATRALAYDLRDQTRRALEYQGVLLAMYAADEVSDARDDTNMPTLGLIDVGEPLTGVLQRTKRATLAGIRLVDTHGIVVVSSGDGLGVDLSQDEEVRQALTVGDVGVAVRPRPTGPSASIRSVRTPSRRASVRLFVTVPILLDGEQRGKAMHERAARHQPAGEEMLGDPVRLVVDVEAIAGRAMREDVQEEPPLRLQPAPGT